MNSSLPKDHRRHKRGRKGGDKCKSKIKFNNTRTRFNNNEMSSLSTCQQIEQDLCDSKLYDQNSDPNNTQSCKNAWETNFIRYNHKVWSINS